MATAVESHVYPEIAPTPLIPVAPLPIKLRARRHWAKWVVLAGVIVAMGVGAELWRVHSQNAIGYETVPVEQGLIQASVTATGTLNAVVDVQVGSQVSGNIQALYADFNTKVTKGQLVALIDPQVFQTQVDQAQAAAASAQALVQKAKSDLAGTIASEKSAESVVAKDRATALNGSNQYQRQDGLFKGGLISSVDHDLAKANFDAAEAQVVADQSLVDASKQSILSAQAQLASVQGQGRQAQAALDQAKINLAHTRIVAPVDGTVIARNMNVGQTVAASFQVATIFDIAQDLTKMQVDTNVDESDIGNISAGQNATFTVDAYPGTTFNGQVMAVRKAPINAQNVVTYDVVIAVANPDIKLFPGMTANARILTAKLDNVLKVPNAVLRVHPSATVATKLNLSPAPAGKQQVYVLTAGKLRAVPATFGISDGKSTAVTLGDLHEGDQVVTRFITAASAPPASAPSAPGAAAPRRGSGF